MMDRRRAMMRKVGGGGGLPEGYTRVEYLCSARAYIDTGVISTSNIRMVVDLSQWLTIPCLGNYGIRANSISNFGSRASGEAIGLTKRSYKMTGYFDYGSNSPYISQIWAYNTRYVYDFSNGAQIINGVLKKTLSGDFSGTNTLWLFSARSAEYFGAGCDMYSAQIYDSNVLIRDYVPAQREIDGKFGMYDLCGSICPLTNSPFYTSCTTDGDYKDFYYPAIT